MAKPFAQRLVQPIWTLIVLLAICAMGMPLSAWADEPMLSMDASALDADASGLGEPITAGQRDIALQDRTEPYPVFGLGIAGDFHQSEARKLLDLINQARAAAGVSPLAYNTDLEQVAMVRAAECQASFSHTRPNGADCFSAAQEMGFSYGRAAGENIAMGYHSASDVNRGWTDSPGHYQNMINPSFTSVGVAAFEMDGVWTWVEFFGANSGSGFNTDPVDGAMTVTTTAQAAFLPLIFQDVNPNDWYIAQDHGEKFIYAIDEGLMSGYDDRMAFGPYDSVTRGQVATVLYRIAGEPAASAPDFSDVDYGAYYGDAIRWARSVGVVNGLGDTNTFGPDMPVTREQFCTMLANYARIVAGLDTDPSPSGSSLPDWGSVSLWARDSVAWALNIGLINGVQTEGGGREIRPGDTADRCQAAVIFATFHRDVLN